MAIFDRFKRKELATAKLPQTSARPTLGEMATRDTAESLYGFLSLLPNPDPVLRKAGMQLAAYRELLTDEHLGSVVDSRKDSVRELEWSIDRGKAKSRQTRAIEEIFAKLNVYQIITEMLDAPLFGYQPMELIWSERNGLIWLDNVVGKPQEWFAFNSKNEPRFLDPMSGTIDGVGLPPGKFVIPTHDPRYVNPYGVPLLSRVFWPVTFAKGGLKFWITFIEKYGMPWVKASYPDEQEQEEVNKLVTKIDEMVHDAIIATPLSTNTEVIPNGQRASAEIYAMFIDLCEKRISKAILGHGAAADSTAGRLGNEESAMNAKWGRAASDKRLVTAAMNEIIRWIHAYNFDAGEPPVFTFYEEEDVDQATAERDQKLYSIGWRPTIPYLQETYGFKDDHLKLLPSASITETVGGVTAINELVKAYEMRQISRDGAMALARIIFKVPEEEVEELFVKDLPPAPPQPTLFAENGEELEGTIQKVQQSNRVAASLVDPVEELLATAGSFDEALDMLSTLYPKLNSEELERRLRDLLFTSELIGRISAKDGEDA